MRRRLFLLPALALAVLCLGSPVQASDTCARSTGGKCKVGQTAPPKNTKGGVVTKKATQPIPKGNHKGRDDYTPAQRDKMMEQARQLCRKKYGAPSRVYRVDFKRNTVWCEPASN
ncbi:MAG: hypothetical protein U1E16_11825 [Hyphomicrobiales bacterium]|uniref:hypothetical protein n=1 Tax=Aestuariivirga sp. TaxID=2650926 RepID=UPI0035B12C5D